MCTKVGDWRPGAAVLLSPGCACILAQCTKCWAINVRLTIMLRAPLQVWAGTKQKELGLNGMQLLHQVSPIAVMLLGVLIPALEPVGFGKATPGTILAYEYSLVSL